MKKMFVVLSLIGVVSLSACDSNARLPVSTSEAELLSNTVNNVVVPALEQFSDSASELHKGAVKFCNAPNAAQLAFLQAQWRQLSQSWYALALYNVGPLDELGVSGRTYFRIDSLRVRGTDYADIVASAIQTSIAASDVLNEEYFASLVFSHVGLLPLEYLLFEEYLNTGGSDNAAILAEFSNARKCAWLSGLSQQLAELSMDVFSQWSDSFQGGKAYKDTLLSSAAAGDSLLIIINAVQSYFDYLKLRDVISVSGKISANGWTNASASIDAVELLLEGGGQTPSIFTQMQAAGSVNGLAQVKDSIASARTAIADRNRDTLNIAFGLIDGHFKREIPDALTLVQGINFSDGD